MKISLRKIISVLFCVVFSCSILFFELEAALISSNFVWEFDSGITDPDAQGWRLEDCDNPQVRDGILSFGFSPESSPRLVVKKNMWKSRIVPADYAALVVNMRVIPSKGIGAFDGNIEFQWNAGKGKTCSKKIKLINDGSTHAYRFDLTGESWSKLKKNYGDLKIIPAADTKKFSGRVFIDSIRFVPCLRVIDREKASAAEKRVNAARERLAGLSKHGIVIKGAREALKKLHKELQGLKTQQEAFRLAKYGELEKRFAVIYARLELGRKIAGLKENITAIEKSLAFRKSPDTKAVLELNTEIKSISDCLADGSFDGLSGKIQASEDKCLGIWNSLLTGKAWQLGVSDASFGRFGWVNKNDGMLFGEVGKNQIVRRFFKFSNGANAILRFEPVNAVPVSCTIEQLNWIYRQELYSYRLKNKKNGFWRVRKSLVANGIMLETDIPEIALNINNGFDASPQKIVYKSRDGVQIVSRREGFNIKDMTENWLLLLPSGETSAVPWLVTFQHCPESFIWESGRLLFGRAKGMGCIGITAPWGVKPLKSSFAAGWRKVPDKAALRCQLAAEVMNSFPIACDEFFALNRKSGLVDIIDRYRYFEPGNDWNTKARRVAPVPPVLPFAIAHGYPAVIRGRNIMPDISTIYGPYYACAGNRVEYTIPLPDLRSPVPLKTPQFPEWQHQMNKLVKSFFPLKVENNPLELMPMRSQTCLYGWNIIDKEAKNMLLDNIKVSLDWYLNFQDKLGSFDSLNNRTNERTEPFSGASYLAYGWESKRFGKVLMGDISNFAGMDLYAFSQYLKFSGDLKYIKSNWSKIVRLFSSCPRRSDWAVMGLDCMEYGLTHTIDMGPDSWLAPVGMSKLAADVGDRRLEDLSLYMAARQAVPLCAAFSKRPLHMEFSNIWDWKKQIPETGYTEYGAISGIDWKRADLVFSFIAGIVIAPECFRLYRDFCPDAARKFEYGTLEKYYPQWKNPKYRYHPKKSGRNAPGPITRNVLLREALGEPTGNLVEIVRNGLLEGTEEKLYRYVPCGGLTSLDVMAKAFLIGRDAPCEISDWGTSRLVEAKYDPEKKIVSAVFEADEPFRINFISKCSPDRVMLNGRPLEKSKWRFDAQRQNLTVNAGPRSTSLTFTYDNWKAPQRVALKADAKIKLTPEMILCRDEKQNAGSYGNDRKDFQYSGNPVYINLTGVLNMSTAACPVKNGWGWLGMENHAPSSKGTGLSSLHFGNRKFRGVPFQLLNPRYHSGKSVVGLYGSRAVRLPKKCGQVKIGKRLRKLYFLHTASWDSSNGATVLKYHIKYSDGHIDVVKINSGQEIGDWWSPRELTNARLAFRLPTGPERKGHVVGAYISVWENNRYEQVAVNNAATEQRPLAQIESIEIESTGVDGAVAVIAITGEKI